jgi:creatinine amidohydrolase
MPPIPYGYKSQPHTGGGQSFPGTTSLNGATLVSVVRDILSELFRHGAKRVCLYNGHFENVMFVTEAIDLALADAPAPSPRVLLLRSPPFIQKKTLDTIYHGNFPGWDGEHAGVFETSLLMALQPQLVATELLAPDEPERQPGYQVFPPTKDMIVKSGVLSSPVGASADKGSLLLNDIIPGAIAALCLEFGLRSDA